MAESYQKGKKTMWEKELLHIMSNFSLSHSVFKRLVSKGPLKKMSDCGNGLKCKYPEWKLFLVITICLPKKFYENYLNLLKWTMHCEKRVFTDENRWNFTQLIENTVGNGEIARYFLVNLLDGKGPLKLLFCEIKTVDSGSMRSLRKMPCIRCI